jgi:hypothetical protein
MHGLLQVISLMLALAGFGVDEDAKAPSGATVLAYAVEDADAMIYADVAAVAPRNYDVLVGLPDAPAIKASPDLLALVKMVTTNVEGVRGMGKALAGVDLVDDVTSLTVFIDVVPGATELTRMVVARGKFPKDLVDKLTKVAGGTAGTVDGRSTLAMDAATFIGTAKDGTLIIGPKSWVEPRIDDDWKAPKRKKGTPWATVAKYLDAGPFLLFAGKLDAADAPAYGKELGANFLSDLATSHELAIVALQHDGLSLYWKDRTKDHLKRMALAVDGVIDLMRAGHIAPRGMAKLLVAALDSYAGASPELDELIAHKDDLLALVESYSGDGKFKAEIKKDTKARTLTVRASGKKLSDVVPVAMLAPLVVAGILFAEPPAPPPPPPKPKSTRPRLQPLPKPKGG